VLFVPLSNSLDAHPLFKLPPAAELSGPEATARPPEPLPCRDDARRDAPLSFAQQGVWLLERFEPGSALHNLPAAFRLTGPLDPERRAEARRLALAEARQPFDLAQAPLPC